MAFEVPKTGYQQIDPTFLPGYAYKAEYHNVGQLQTPYQGKFFGQNGDYAPPQRTRYYTVQNPTYPYVMDSDFRAEQYLPTEGRCYDHPGYFPCYETKYPEYFVPPNYFAPQIRHPAGHALPIDEDEARKYSGSVMEFDPADHPTEPFEYGSTSPTSYKKLRVAHKSLENNKNYFPFDRSY
uniref:Uncharacterized protein n=1 Tax=Marseillevirus LCMAC102 TaxID=2506603 RepID=A0A481YTM4_9VIRU|nr:MAG: hypothetical protein LCMAC102_03170 [Marseillevirus LCMAC102]